jgi:hypothetical protein
MKKYIIFSVFCLLYTSCCTPQTKKIKKNNDIMEKSAFVISETKDGISYLGNIQRYDDINPETGEENFYLNFDINFHVKTKAKTPKISTNSGYTMYVEMIDGSYKTRLQLQSSTFYEDGVNVGHAEPNGEWYEDDELATLILNYYHSNKATIPVHTKNIDISRWTTLFTLSEDNYSSQHVLKLKLSELDSVTGQFTLDCELLTVNNVLVNNELSNYAISTHTLRFIPGKRYLVQIKHNSTTAYINNGKDVIEYQIPDKIGETRYADEVQFSHKVLEYYLSHKNEFNIGDNIER